MFQVCRWIVSFHRLTWDRGVLAKRVNSLRRRGGSRGIGRELQRWRKLTQAALITQCGRWKYERVSRDGNVHMGQAVSNLLTQQKVRKQGQFMEKFISSCGSSINLCSSRIQLKGLELIFPGDRYGQVEAIIFFS